MSNIGVESNIDIENEHTFKTIEAFKQAYKEKGLVPEYDDFPKDKRRMLERLKRFNARIDPSKPITKRIISMVRQPVHVTENGKRITKDSLIFHATIEGYNWADVPLGVEYSGGFYLRPNLRFSVQDSKRPFDPETGQKVGSYVSQGVKWEHTISYQKTRRKESNN